MNPDDFLTIIHGLRRNVEAHEARLAKLEDPGAARVAEFKRRLEILLSAEGVDEDFNLPSWMLAEYLAHNLANLQWVKDAAERNHEQRT